MARSRLAGILGRRTRMLSAEEERWPLRQRYTYTRFFPVFFRNLSIIKLAGHLRSGGILLELQGNQPYVAVQHGPVHLKPPQPPRTQPNQL